MRNEIVVGLDDSPSSKLALQWAAQHAKSTGAELRAVHVYSTELEDTYRQAITAVFEAVSPRPNWALELLCWLWADHTSLGGARGSGR